MEWPFLDHQGTRQRVPAWHVRWSNPFSMGERISVMTLLRRPSNKPVVSPDMLTCILVVLAFGFSFGTRVFFLFVVVMIALTSPQPSQLNTH